jgi:uncharacterized protein
MPSPFTNPVITRSRAAIEIAAEFVASHDTMRHARVTVSDEEGTKRAITLTGASTNQGIVEVASGKIDLAIINPSSALTVAYRGMGQWKEKQPVRAIAVIPSLDQFVFAVKAETGLTSMEDIARKRPPLKVSLRGTPNHCIQIMLDHIAAAAGWTLDDLRAWGGEPRREGSLPWPDSPKWKALARGEINAIFDEAAPIWVDLALDAGMTILPLAEASVSKLEAMGYRRALIRKADYPRLPADVLTIDFSGWTIYVNERLEDDIVRRICAGLDARKTLIPWEQPGPLPVERMCIDAPDTPLDVPFHPAAERFWRERGYLR